MRLLTGVGAAAAFASGDVSWQYIGAFVFVVSLALDRADGELARLGGTSSPWGHKFDLVADAASNALVFIGLGIGAREGGLGSEGVLLGALAAAALVAVLVMVLRIEARQGPHQAELPSFAGFDADDALLIIPVAVWLGGVEPLLVAAAIGTPAFALFFLWQFRRVLFSPRGDGMRL